LVLHKEIDQSRWALHAASFQSKTQRTTKIYFTPRVS
jgi:hypothetical protein